MALSTMRVGAAPRVAVARVQTVKVVARGSWRGESSTVTAQPAAPKKATTPNRSALPANWKQELESLRGSSSPAPSAPAPAPRSSSASWRSDSSSAPAPAKSAPATSPKKATTPTRSALPANWKQELESLRGSSSPAPSAPAPAKSAPSASPKKATTPNRSALPANWKQELESLRGSSSPAPSAPAPAPRSSSASWRSDSSSAPAPAKSAPSASPKKATTPTRSALPANWKQELESLRGKPSAAPAAPAPAAPARSSSASWRDSPAPAAKDAAANKAGSNPWTGKSKVEIKRTTLPADWRKNA